MKDFHCRDTGEACDFIARGDSEQEVMRAAGEHAKDAHQRWMSPELAQKVEGLIHDEDSDAHRRSMAQAGEQPQPSA